MHAAHVQLVDEDARLREALDQLALEDVIKVLAVDGLALPES